MAPKNRTVTVVRAPVTWVVDARSASVRGLAGLVEALGSTLGERDLLVVVDPPAGQPNVPMRSVGRIGNRFRRQHHHDAILDQLHQARPADVIVVIDATVALATPASLNELVQTLQRAGADAAVACSNTAPWPQCPPDPLPSDATRSEQRATARSCLERDRGRWVDITTPASGQPNPAAGGAIALAPRGLDRTGGPAQPEARLTAAGLHTAGLPTVVALGAYVHRIAPQPQISVCMIMKNEAGELADCLASVAALADEIVIYDTGSTDGSIELARSLGATVIEGSWRNDFAWARNQAMDATRGTWLLSIDADERLEIDGPSAAELRNILTADPALDRFIIKLFDLQGSVHAPVRSPNAVPMARLFRRRNCRWIGALHEQPDSRPGRAAPRSAALPGLTFLHRGYLDEIVTQKNKWERNLTVATAGLDKVPDNDKDCFDLGRSLRSVGEHGRAFSLFERAAALGQNLVVTRGALEFAILSLTESGQAALAAPHLERLRGLPEGAGPARYLQGWVYLQLNCWAQALDCFEGIGVYNDHFTGFRAESVDLGLALAHRALGHRDQAANAAAAALRCNSLALDAWAVLFDTAAADGRLEADVAATLPAEHLVPLFAALANFAVSYQDRLAEARWQAYPGEKVVLAAASQLGADLDPDRAIIWSARLRAHGLAALCPIKALAQDTSITSTVRAGTLASALDRLDNVSGIETADLVEALEALVVPLDNDELHALLTSCLNHHQGAAGAVILAGATTVTRCLIAADVLLAAEFAEHALAVLAHAAALDPNATRSELRTQLPLAGGLRAAATAAARVDLDHVLAHAA